MPTIKIYTTPNCVYCQMAKNFFNKLNIAYENHDISRDLKTREMVFHMVGAIGVPVIDVDGEIFVGFDRDGLKRILNLA